MEKYRNITQDGLLIMYSNGKVFNKKTKSYISPIKDRFGSMYIGTNVNGKAIHFSLRKKLNELFPELFIQDNEVYKDIVGYEGLYQISNLGNVRSFVRNRILKNKVDSDGYNTINLYKNRKCTTYKVHRLVAEYFISTSDMTINHIDFDKTNNSVDNLEYMTSIDNIINAWKNGRYDTEKFRNRRLKTA